MRTDGVRPKIVLHIDVLGEALSDSAGDHRKSRWSEPRSLGRSYPELRAADPTVMEYAGSPKSLFLHPNIIHAKHVIRVLLGFANILGGGINRVMSTLSEAERQGIIIAEIPEQNIGVGEHHERLDTND